MERRSSEARNARRRLGFKSKSGEDLEILVADLPHLVSERPKSCRSFGELLVKKIVTSSDHKLTILMCHDSATPGKVLQPKLDRKATLVYCSFLETDAWLSRTYSRMTIAVLPEQTLQSLEASTTEFVKSLMALWSKTVLRTGITFEAAGKVWHFSVKDIAFIADEAGLKQTFSNKGASGIKPCVKCGNVLRTSAPIARPFVHLSEHDPAKFHILSDAEIFMVADHAQASKEQKGFKELQTSSGLTFQESGLLWDREIREILPPSKGYL